MPDSFADLDALAAQGDDGKTLFKVENVWSYPGAPRPNLNQANLRLPSPNVPHARVQAALDVGAWVVRCIDIDNSPRAVVKADLGGEPIVAQQPQTFGTVSPNG